MVKRTLIKIYEDMDHVNYMLHTDKGDFDYSCSLNDWKAYELKLKFVKLGCDEKEVDELYSLGYSEGSDDAEESYLEEEY